MRKLVPLILPLAFVSCAVLTSKPADTGLTDEQHKAMVTAIVLVEGGCTTLAKTIKPTEKADVAVALGLVEDILQGGTPQTVEQKLLALMKNREAKLTPLIASVIYVGSLQIPPDARDRLYMSVVTTAVTMCRSILETV